MVYRKSLGSEENMNGQWLKVGGGVFNVGSLKNGPEENVI